MGYQIVCIKVLPLLVCIYMRIFCLLLSTTYAGFGLYILWVTSEQGTLVTEVFTF
jgi:hypothetical protein